MRSLRTNIGYRHGRLRQGHCGMAAQDTPAGRQAPILGNGRRLQTRKCVLFCAIMISRTDRPYVAFRRCAPRRA